MMGAFTIGNIWVERDGPPLVMAEIGVNHNGDMGAALELVRAAKAAGADAVKFQLFKAKLLLAKTAGLVAYQESAAGSADELLEPLELDGAQLAVLVEAAHKVEMAAVVTPFSVDLITVAVGTACDAIKIASPDCVNRPLLEAAAASDLPLIVSTGGASLDEVLASARWLQGVSDRLAFLQCVSSYPTEPGDAALGGITALRAALAQTAIGYSDHTTSNFTGALAVAAGACILEKHLTLDRGAAGPDHAASLEPRDFASYADEARLAYLMRGPIRKAPLAVEAAVHRETRQSVVAARGLRAGEVIAAADIVIKRPGTGIPAALVEAIIGRRMIRNVAADQVLTWQDVQGEGA
jgi:N,N'-diacetyllegionaminate synthase